MQEEQRMDSVAGLQLRHHQTALSLWWQHAVDVRRDRYEKHLQVYWVESQMAGRRLTFVCIFVNLCDIVFLRVIAYIYKYISMPWLSKESQRKTDQIRNNSSSLVSTVFALRKRRKTTFTEEEEVEEGAVDADLQDVLPNDFILPEDNSGENISDV